MNVSKEYYVIYSRKSRFTGKGESIENQIEMCKQYLMMKLDVSEDMFLVYEDEGFSGKSLERPQFKKMMEDAQKMKFKAIVVYRLDRISRNIGDFAKLIEQLRRNNIDFISIKENFDTSSPMGRAMMYIASVFSQLERETIAERIKDNMHELAKTGRWLGGVTPTGYASTSTKKITIDGKMKKTCHLTFIPEEIEIVKLIADLFLKYNSLTQTEKYLLQHHYKTKKGNLFTRFSIRNILTNPVYMIADQDAYRYLKENDACIYADEKDFDGTRGLLVYNRTLQEDGKANKLLPIDEWIISLGQHEGVFAGETWVKMQKMLEQNKSKNYRKPRSHVALLSGVLRCGSCGEYMRPKLSSRLNSKGERIYTYLCSLKERSNSHLCASKNVQGNILDAAVTNEIKKLSHDQSDFMKQLEQGKKAIQKSTSNYDKETEHLESEMKELESALNNVVLSLGKAANDSTREFLLAQVDEMTMKKKALETKLEEMSALMESNPLSDSDLDVLTQTLLSFSSMVDTMTIEQQREAIRIFVKKIVWDGENAHLYLFGSEEEFELPDEKGGRGESSEQKPLGENSK